MFFSDDGGPHMAAVWIPCYICQRKDFWKSLHTCNLHFKAFVIIKAFKIPGRDELGQLPEVYFLTPVYA